MRSPVVSWTSWVNEYHELGWGLVGVLVGVEITEYDTFEIHRELFHRQK